MNRVPALFFIGIIPPPKITDDMIAFKQDFAGRFKSAAALRVMPHITLKAPFRSAAGDRELVLHWFERMKIRSKSFEQELNGFGNFPEAKSPVVYVRPVINPLILALQRELLDHFREAFPREKVPVQEIEFIPHMTIAYKDLQPAMFREAWEEFAVKPYKATFTVNSFHLLRNEGDGWKSIAERALEFGS